MESYEYIESAIIFNLNSKENLKAFKYSERDFNIHGPAYAFINNYWDTTGTLPTQSLLTENFPSLDISSIGVDFNYALNNFGKLYLTKKAVNAGRKVRSEIQDDPKKAIATLINDLTSIQTNFDEDIYIYDKGTDERYTEYESRIKIREKGSGLMGVPTSFKSINAFGVGWMPGELIAIFARPTIGKTWMCVHAAATAINKGFKTLLISTEMPARAINMRLDVVLANMMGYEFSHTDLRRGNKINTELYKDFLSHNNRESLLICDHIPGQVGISQASIATLIRKYNPEFVVIDGVYLISGNNSKKAAWEQNHELFYGLKNLATSMDVPILVTTQATRDASNMFTPPRADQVAFGDALIRAADAALAMCAIENDDNKRMVQFQKYRDGAIPKLTTVLDWDVDIGNINELENYNVDDF